MTNSPTTAALDDLPLFDAWDAPEFSAETGRAAEDLFAGGAEILRGSDGSIVFYRNDDVRTIASTPDVTHQSTESMAAYLREVGGTGTDGLVRFVDKMTFSMRPPEHLPTKQLSSRRLSAQGVARLAADASAAIEGQLSRVADGSVIDFDRDFVGLAVVDFWTRVLGVTREEGEALLVAMRDLSSGFRLGGDAQQFVTASGGCDRYMEILPQALLRESEHGRVPLLAELSADFDADSAGVRPQDPFEVFAAALADSFMTLPALVTNATAALLLNQAAHARVRADRSLVTAAFLEGSRLNPPIIYTRREAARDFTYKGRAIPQGTAVSILWFCANRDPAVFRAPAVYELERENRARQTTFGRGLYACVGRHLAKMFCETVIAALTAPAVQISLTQDVTWMRGHTLREIERLAVTVRRG